MTHQMGNIPLVVAHVLDQLRVRQKVIMQRRLPRLRIRFRIVDRDLHGHVTEVASAELFDRVQRVGMRMAVVIQPAFVVEAARFGDKRVALPAADRVTEPGRLRLRGSARPSVKTCRYSTNSS